MDTPERAPDLKQDLNELRRALDELASSASAPRPEAEAVQKRATEAVSRLERASKTQRLDFASFLEMAGRINAQGLDLEKIESYVTTLLRGRTGAATVALLRATDEDGVLVATRGGGPLRRLELASQLARRLTSHGRPIALEDGAATILGDEVKAFADAALVAPLCQMDQSERVLRGVLVLGKKITGQPYGEREIEFLGLISELVAIALHNAFLHYTATHDALTRTWSRGYFDVELKREISRSNRRRAKEVVATFSLIMADLDHFKRINDTFGHRMGDKVLQLVATTLRATIRDYDTLARWGGEEFAIILPDVGKASALEAAERYRRAIAAAAIPKGASGEHLPPVTASFGVASFPDDGEEPRDLLQRADDALYRSKEAGRNCVSGA
ncbi:MAG: diguanylate cyclase [Planctomycetota bacterium]